MREFGVIAPLHLLRVSVGPFPSPTFFETVNEGSRGSTSYCNGEVTDNSVTGSDDILTR